MILAGDVGGTNTRLAFFELKDQQLKKVALEVYPSGEHDSLKEIVSKFTSEHDVEIESACFGVAGPIKDGTAKVSNLPWLVDSQKLASLLDLDQVQLINDLEANAHGIAALEPKDFVTLNEGTSNPTGNEALISAGTGLGEAGLYWDGSDHQPFASEGGHADFAPRNELEIEMLSYMLKSCEHVSFERFLSGPGLVNIYEFLVQRDGAEQSDWLRDELASGDQGDQGPVISKAALENRDDVCVQSLDMFVSIYASEAANLALKVLATGGVFIGGGIAPKIIEKLKEPAFLESFFAKGRMSSLLEGHSCQSHHERFDCVAGCSTRREFIQVAGFDPFEAANFAANVRSTGFIRNRSGKFRLKSVLQTQAGVPCSRELV